jgi:hypothetical protein
MLVVSVLYSLSDHNFERLYPSRGGKVGPITFCKKPSGYDKISKPATWTYGQGGLGTEAAHERQIGDIHFSPSASDSGRFDYWVVCQEQSGERCWAMCAEGQGHPVYDGYVLKGRDGKLSPRWVLIQSFRKHIMKMKKGQMGNGALR